MKALAPAIQFFCSSIFRAPNRARPAIAAGTKMHHDAQQPMKNTERSGKIGVLAVREWGYYYHCGSST
jgi:hypothetical protein